MSVQGHDRKFSMKCIKQKNNEKYAKLSSEDMVNTIISHHSAPQHPSPDETSSLFLSSSVLLLLLSLVSDVPPTLP